MKSKNNVSLKRKVIAVIVSLSAMLIVLPFLSGCPNKEKAADVSKGKEMVKLKIGDMAPAFELLEQN